jgi:hypothetical protein
MFEIVKEPRRRPDQSQEDYDEEKRAFLERLLGIPVLTPSELEPSHTPPPWPPSKTRIF